MGLALDDDHERVRLYRVGRDYVRVEEGMPAEKRTPKILAWEIRGEPVQERLLMLNPVDSISARAGVLPFLILPGDPVLVRLRDDGIVAAGHALGAWQIPPPNLGWMLRFEIDEKATRALMKRPVSEETLAPMLPERDWSNLVDLGAHWDVLGEAVQASVSPRRPNARRPRGTRRTTR